MKILVSFAMMFFTEWAWAQSSCEDTFESFTSQTSNSVRAQLLTRANDFLYYYSMSQTAYMREFEGYRDGEIRARHKLTPPGLSESLTAALRNASLSTAELYSYLDVEPYILWLQKNQRVPDTKRTDLQTGEEKVTSGEGQRISPIALFMSVHSQNIPASLAMMYVQALLDPTMPPGAYKAVAKAIHVSQYIRFIGSHVFPQLARETDSGWVAMSSPENARDVLRRLIKEQVEVYGREIPRNLYDLIATTVASENKQFEFTNTVLSRHRLASDDARFLFGVRRRMQTETLEASVSLFAPNFAALRTKLRLPDQVSDFRIFELFEIIRHDSPRGSYGGTLAQIFDSQAAGKIQSLQANVELMDALLTHEAFQNYVVMRTMFGF